MAVRIAPLPRVLCLLIVMSLSSCGGVSGSGWVELKRQSSESGQTLHITGTVRHLELEGGLFVIRDPQGTQYNPINLPDAFRHEGLAVEAEARRRDDMASIGMVGPIIELLRIRQRPGDTGRTSGLWGTSWRLEDLAGAGVLDAVQATLEFPEQGSVHGSGSCNRFHGTVTLRENAITFGPLASTRMSCGEAVMNQETQYFAALGKATRFEIKEPFLYIHLEERRRPLRFIRY